MVRLILKSIVYPNIPLPIPHPKCYFMYILASFYHYVQTLSCFSVSAFSGPLKSTFLDDLQKNKNGIHVSTETDFGKVELGGRKKLTVWIQNKGETNQVFLRAHLPAECTQIKVQGLYSHSLCKWNKKFLQWHVNNGNKLMKRFARQYRFPAVCQAAEVFSIASWIFTFFIYK